MRFKFVPGIDRQPRNLTIFQNVHVVELNHGSRTCSIPLSSPLGFTIFRREVDSFLQPQVRFTCLWHRCSRCELAPLFFRFFEAIFLPAKVQDFGTPKLILDPRAFAFVVSHEHKDSEDENTSSFGTRTSF